MSRIAIVVPYARLSIGPAYLSAALRSRGHDVSVIYFKKYEWAWMGAVEHADTSQFHTMYTSSGADRVYCYPRPCTEVEAENLLSILRNTNPDCVGISLSYVSFDTAAELTRLIQSRLSVRIPVFGR